MALCVFGRFLECVTLLARGQRRSSSVWFGGGTKVQGGMGDLAGFSNESCRESGSWLR